MTRALFCGISNPESRVAVFTSFSDETASADPAGIFLVGGYIGDVDFWGAFAGEWNERIILSEPRIPYLHMREIRNPEFQKEHGLTREQASQKVDAAVDLIASHKSDLVPVAFGITLAEFREIVQRPLRALRLNRQDIREPDYPCFAGYARTAIHEIHQKRADVERVNFIVSRKKTVSHHLGNFHEEMRDWMSKHEPALVDLVGHLTPADMIEHRPLQAADVFAWWYRDYLEHSTNNRNATLLCCESVRYRKYTTEELRGFVDGVKRAEGFAV
jgi:hypothetical protein